MATHSFTPAPKTIPETAVNLVSYGVIRWTTYLKTSTMLDLFSTFDFLLQVRSKAIQERCRPSPEKELCRRATGRAMRGNAVLEQKLLQSPVELCFGRLGADLHRPFEGLDESLRLAVCLRVTAPIGYFKRSSALGKFESSLRRRQDRCR